MILVGSVLMFRHHLLSPSRLEKYKEGGYDLDVIVATEKDKQDLLNVSGINYDVLVHPKVHQILSEAMKTLKVPVVVQSLKLSHMHYDLPSWHKHLHDIKHIDSLGIKPDMDLVFKLKAEWTEYYKGKDKIKLNKKPKEFFKASYNQNHDALHEHFKLTDTPIYKKFLQDGSEIAVDKQKFESLSYIEQLYSVVEESMVVAYERKLSLINGFKHVYTKLSKNWWNDFITTNFVVIISFLTEFNKYFKETSKHDSSI